MAYLGRVNLVEFCPNHPFAHDQISFVPQAPVKPRLPIGRHGVTGWVSWGYLDAWCHMWNELRNFAVDSILRAEVLEKKAKDVSRSSMDEILGPGYGIFNGKDLQWAKLKFSPERARWVAQEHWHPKQKGTLEKDGSFVLELPYTDDRELIMDILKFGAEVEVLGPPLLKKRVKAEIGKMSAHYV